MHERSEADAFLGTHASGVLHGRGVRTILFREPLPLGMIIRQLKRAIHQAFKIHLLANDLIRSSRLTCADEIPPPKFVRR